MLLHKRGNSAIGHGDNAYWEDGGGGVVEGDGRHGKEAKRVGYKVLRAQERLPASPSHLVAA